MRVSKGGQVFSLIVMLLAIACPSEAAGRVGVDVNTAFAGAAALIQWESPTLSRLNMSVTTSADGLSVSYRVLAAAREFSFFSGPEIMLATDRHGLTRFLGYGFGYVLDRDPVQVEFSASIGVGEGPAARPVSGLLLGPGINLTSLLGLKIMIGL